MAIDNAYAEEEERRLEDYKLVELQELIDNLWENYKLVTDKTLKKRMRTDYHRYTTEYNTRAGQILFSTHLV